MITYEEQYKKVQEATTCFIDNSFTNADELFKAGKYQESADVLFNVADGLEVKNKIVREAQKQRAENMRRVLDVPPHSPKIPSPEATKFKLPQGISKGKVAAIVAGIAVVGGGILLYHQHQLKKRESWAARIAEERTMPTQRGLP